MQPKFKYIHLARRGVTIGYRINDEAGKVEWAMSHAAHGDQFNKAIGRSIVEGRINKGGWKANGMPRSYDFPLSDIGGSTKYADISAFIMKGLGLSREGNKD